MTDTKTINKFKISRLPAINNELLRFKAFYFFFLSGFGSLLPYMPVYFRQIGLSASHVGFLIGIRPIVQFASAPFWAIMADRYRKRKPILIMSILAWLIMTLSLAFVEPTSEICEMRTESNSSLQFLNYTKLRTGFFRRSLTETTYFAGKLGTNSAALSMKTSSKNRRRNSYIVNGTNSSMLAPEQQSNHTMNYSPLNSYIKSKTSVNKTTEQPSIIFQESRNNHKNTTLILEIQRKHNDISHKTRSTSDKQTGTQPNKKASVPKRSSTQRENDKKKSVYLKRGSKTPSVDNGESLKNSSNKGKRLDVSKTPSNKAKSSSQQKPKSSSHQKPNFQRSTIEFSKDDANDGINQSKIRIDHGGMSSGSGENPNSLRDENTKTISIPKHVKEAADKLQNQLAKSITILNKLAKNSTAALLHHTMIKIVSKKVDEGKTVVQTSTPKTIPQLHNAIKTFMKSSPRYKTALNSEGSGTTDEGSSLLLSSNNDLSHLAFSHFNPGNGIDGSQDNLHRIDQQETSKGVIHHNVLPHHVLAFGHNTPSLTVAEMLAGQDDSKLGSGSGEPPRGSQSILGNTLGNISITQKDDKTPKKYYTVDSRKNEENFTNTLENLVVPSTLSGVMDHVNTTLRNLFKSNEHEMSRIFTIFLVLIVVGEFLESPSATLADASLLEVLGEKKQFYGRQRLFGSIGFGVCSFFVGIMLERSRHKVCGEENVDYTICFCAFGIMMFMTFLVTSSFEFHYSDSQSSSGSVLSSLCNMHYGSCLAAACIMGVDFSMSHNFLAWLLEDLGASKSLLGLAVISRCFADTVTFYFAGSIIKRIGQVHVMIMVFISYTVILLAFSVIDNPTWVIPLEIVDGVTYALAWSALTSYLAGAVPPDSVTTIQGILQGVYWGLGSGSGAITGGYLIHHFGVFQTFQFMAGLTLFFCLIFSTIQWRWTNTAINEQPRTKYTYLPTVETKDTDELLSGYHIPGLPTRIKGKFIKNHIAK